MVRGISVILSIGLTIVWLAGLHHHATAWLTWLDGLGALCGFGIAIGAGPVTLRSTNAGTCVVLAIGLAILWIIGLATHREQWLIWWTFAFACGFLFLGLAVGAAHVREATRAHRPRAV